MKHSIVSYATVELKIKMPFPGCVMREIPYHENYDSGKEDGEL